MKPLENFQNKFTDYQQTQYQLPIYGAKQRFIEEIKKNDCAIVIGETASGKTTQIPQFILKEHLNKNGMIACTQPRRVAAITIAERVSKELGSEIGTDVGYCVRFEDCTTPTTKIKYMTDGMLLREAIGDKLLKKYSFVILDEAHERTIHTDVLFGIVKNAQAVRRKSGTMTNLNIIIMSATMDMDHFSNYFNKAPVLYIEGRLFPIKLQYTEESHKDYCTTALATLFQLHQVEPPEDDILIFLTGQDEIEAMSESIKEISLALPGGLPKLHVCPLFASLPHHQQLKAFKQTPKGHRKVVLSTNIAETSVTIKGIKFVIDTGRVKAKTFHPSSGLDVLACQWISQAQAWQRAGRAGRERPGVVYRLYTEEEFFMLRQNSTPEIQRCNLSSTILQLLSIGIKDVANFDFIDPPNRRSLSVALEELKLLKGVADNSFGIPELTLLGKNMSSFPLEPKLAKSLVCSVKYNCVEEMLSLISMLSVESIMYTPHTKRDEANTVRKKFTASEGDFVMLLNIYRAFKQNKGNKTWCYENYINLRNMTTVLDIRKQLRDLCLRAKVPVSSSHRDMIALRKSAAAGLFMNAAELHPDGTYRAIDSNQTVHIHPSSCLFQSKPAYVVFSELVQTTKCYMRNLCVVDPDWLYASAPEYFAKKLKSHK